MSIYKIILGTWCCLLVIVSGFLIAEYRFFKQQSEQLSDLKHEYLDYIATFKKLINTSTRQKAERAVIPKKVSLNKEVEHQFLIVNREPAYLKNAALDFARKYHLERDVRKLYQDNAFNSKQTTKKSKQSVKRSTQVPFKARYKSRKLYRLKEFKRLQRKAIFQWPLDKSSFWLSSPFGPRKKTDGSWGFHTGIDLAAPRGTPVKSAHAGIVLQAYYSGGYGNTIVIMHNHTFKTRYAHLDRILVSKGQKVAQGDCIGKVGATGFVRKSHRGGDASHLHFEIYLFNKQVNPFYFLV